MDSFCRIFSLFQVFIGSDLIIFTPDFNEALDENSISQYLDQLSVESGGVVAGYTFVSFPLAETLVVTKTSLSNIARFHTVPQRLVAVSENYFEVSRAVLSRKLISLFGIGLFLSS